MKPGNLKIQEPGTNSSTVCGFLHILQRIVTVFITFQSRY